MSETTERTRYACLLERAMRILAMRNHSEAEFRRKLVIFSERAARFTQHEIISEPLISEDIERVIECCYQHHWLDDVRFTEHDVLERSRKGYGPQRTRMELGQKGVDNTLIDKALSAAEIDWQKQAFDVAERKFGLPLPSEWKEKARVQRYLMTKGFFMRDIKPVFGDCDN